MKLARAVAALVVALFVALAMAGCATRGAREDALPAIAGDAAAHQVQREAALSAIPDWTLQGRVALSNGRDGGSGRIDWRQQGARYAVSLSAPITRQSWRLEGEPGAVRLEGLEGGTRTGADAQALLFEATRWEIPVDALASWVRGAAADPARHGPATPVFGPDGRLAGLQQAGWRIAYANWRAASGAPSMDASLELPYRVEATRDQARVRLVVDAWGQGAPP